MKLFGYVFFVITLFSLPSFGQTKMVGDSGHAGDPGEIQLVRNQLPPNLTVQGQVENARHEQRKQKAIHSFLGLVSSAEAFYSLLYYSNWPYASRDEIATLSPEDFKLIANDFDSRAIKILPAKLEVTYRNDPKKKILYIDIDKFYSSQENAEFADQLATIVHEVMSFAIAFGLSETNDYATPERGKYFLSSQFAVALSFMEKNPSDFRIWYSGQKNDPSTFLGYVEANHRLCRQLNKRDIPQGILADIEEIEKISQNIYSSLWTAASELEVLNNFALTKGWGWFFQQNKEKYLDINEDCKDLRFVQELKRRQRAG